MKSRTIFRFFQSKLSVFGLILIGIFILVSIFGNTIAPDKTENANTQHLQIKLKPPGFQFQNQTFHLGTDGLGRDVLSRIIIGARVSMMVGIFAVLISVVVGSSAGMLSGYYRGWIDRLILWLIHVFWAIPTVLLAMALLMSWKGESQYQIFIIFFAVGMTMWTDTARIVRGQFLQLKEREFVQASQVLGYSDFRINVRHMFPNTFPTIIVITASNFASAILMESGLSYLGLGVQPPTPSWGSMLREYYSYLGTDISYLALFPGLAIIIAVFAFYILGNSLRDALDVKRLD